MPPTPVSTRLPERTGASFQYVGNTALSVIGPVSGRRYHFAKPGAVLDVDARDAASFAKVPILRQVRRQ